MFEAFRTLGEKAGRVLVRGESLNWRRNYLVYLVLGAKSTLV